MRKGIVIAGAVVAVAVVGGSIAMQWAQGRAVAEVERSFAALRAAGAVAEHGPVHVSVWSRTLKIDGIKIAPDGDAAKGISIARLRAEGLGLFSTDFTVDRLDLAEVEYQRSMPDRADFRFGFKVPVINLTGLRLPKSIPDLSRADAMVKAVAYLHEIRARSIGIEKLDASLTMPNIAPPAGQFPPQRSGPVQVNYTYADIKMERIAEGRIGNTTSGKMVFSGTTGSGEIENSGMADIDLLPLFRVGLDKRKAHDGYYLVQGKSFVGKMTIKTPDGGELTIGGITLDGFGIDPTKLSYETWMETMAGAASASQAGQRAPPAQDAAFIDLMNRIYEGMRMDDLQVRDFTMRSPVMGPTQMKIGAMAMQGLQRGKVRLIRLDDFLVPVPGSPARPGAMQTMRIGSFAINSFDVLKTLRIAAAVAPQQQWGQRAPPPGPMEFLAMLEGFEIRDTTVPDTGNGALQIDEAKVSWGPFTDSSVPASARAMFKGVVPVNPRDRNFAMLAQKGIRTMALDLDLASNYEASRQELFLAPVRLKLEHFGLLSGQLTLGNLSPGTYAMLPFQFALVSPQLTLKTLDLKLEDGGLIANVYAPALAATPSSGKPADPIAELKQSLLDPAQPPGNLGAILDALSRFLGQPGQALTLKLSANEAVRLSELSAPEQMMSPGPLARTLEKFAIDVRVAK